MRQGRSMKHPIMIIFSLALASTTLTTQASTTPNCDQQTAQCKHHAIYDFNRCQARHHSSEYRRTVCTPSYQLENDSCFQQRQACLQTYQKEHIQIAMTQASTDSEDVSRSALGKTKTILSSTPANS